MTWNVDRRPRLSQAELQELLTASCVRRGAPGAVVALWRDGRLDVATHGVLNVETGEKVRQDSLFQIGSVTKVLTTTLVMQLVDDGRIELDAPVRRYLPSFRTADLEACASITVRQLLNHTSGLGGDFLTDTGAGPDRLARFVDRCALLPQAHAPGKGFSYSNAAFCVAGRIIEVVTGLEFDLALKRGLLDVMGLRNSFLAPTDLVGRSVSSGHVPDSEVPGQSKRVPTLYTLPASGAPSGSTLMMSVADLIEFGRMHLSDGVAPNGARILSAASAALMRQPTVDVPFPPRDIARCGLGWFVLEPLGGRVFMHDGATVGQYAYMRVHLQTGTVAVLFCNGGAHIDLMMDVYSRALDPWIGVEARPAPRPSATPPTDLQRYAGVYRTVGGDTRIEFDEGRLFRSAFVRFDDTIINQPRTPMAHVADDHFIFETPPMRFPTSATFMEPDEEGRPQVLFSGIRVARRVC